MDDKKRERIILPPDQAANLGQILFDAIHAAGDLNKYVDLPVDERGELDRTEAYIRAWQAFQTDIAALKLRLNSTLALADELADYCDHLTQDLPAAAPPSAWRARLRRQLNIFKQKRSELNLCS